MAVAEPPGAYGPRGPRNRQGGGGRTLSAPPPLGYVLAVTLYRLCGTNGPASAAHGVKVMVVQIQYQWQSGRGA